MKKIRSILLAALLVFTVSCNEEKKVENTQMKKVMAIHDEVMPKMSELGSLVGELSELENDSTALRSQYELARKDLQAAHKSMMDWMQNFGNRFDPDEILNGKELTQQKEKWLDEEEEKVKALKLQINESIENARILINKTD